MIESIETGCLFMEAQFYGLNHLTNYQAATSTIKPYSQPINSAAKMDDEAHSFFYYCLYQYCLYA